MKYFASVLFLLTTMVLACEKTKDGRIIANGKFIAGRVCSTWLIQLDNGTVVQPINLSSFPLTIVNGKEATVIYKLSDYQLNICLEAKAADVISIAYK